MLLFYYVIMIFCEFCSFSVQLCYCLLFASSASIVTVHNTVCIGSQQRWVSSICAVTRTEPLLLSLSFSVVVL